VSKSFYKTKNRNDLKKHYEELKSFGYLNEDDKAYYIVLPAIQRDYESLMKQKADSHTNIVNAAIIDNPPTRLGDSYANSGVLEPLPRVDSQTIRLNDSSTNTNNIKKKIEEENKEKTLTRNDSVDSGNSSFNNNSNQDLINKTYNPQTNLSTEESESNPNEIKELQNSELIEEQSSIYHFHPMQIESQVEKYQNTSSTLFTEDNKCLVINTYINFYKDFPSVKIDINEFEKFLCIYIAQLTMAADINDLNQCIASRPITISTGSIHDFLERVAKKPEVKKELEEFLAELKVQFQ
jgi:hypothetical protein